MKKLILSVMFVSLLLTGCSAKGVTQATPSDISTKFEANETFVVYLGLSYCSACKIFRSIVETVIKSDDITVFYVEYDKEMEKDEAAVKALVENHLQQKETFPYSFPILFVVKDGQIIDQFSLQQTDNEQKFKDRMIQDGVIVQ